MKGPDGRPVGNTEIAYLYRDGSNYKKYGSVVLAGALWPHEGHQIIAACDHEFDEPQFIPHEVGLPALHVDGWDADLDHPWHCLEAVSLVDKPVTLTAPTAAELLALFKARSERWTAGEPPQAERSAHESLAFRKALLEIYSEALTPSRARAVLTALLHATR